MEKLTQKEIIKKQLADDGGWVPGYKLINRHTEHGWLGSSVDRRARELYEDGEIDRKIEGRYVYYKTLAPVQVELYQVRGTDKIIEKRIYG